MFSPASPKATSTTFVTIPPKKDQVKEFASTSGGRARAPRVVVLTLAVMAVIGFNWYLISQYLHGMHETHVQKTTERTIVSQTTTAVEGGLDVTEAATPADGPTKVNFEGKAVPVYSFDKEAWPFTDMDDIVARTIDSKYFGPTALSLHTQDNKDNSKHYSLYKEHERFFDVTGCNLLQVPFDPESDEKCTNYFTNTTNWLELKPLPMEFDQRTAKFEVVYKPIAGSTIQLATMLKVPQRLFPYEAFSEVAAFHADRVLQINRVPPTAWGCVPESIVRNAVKKHGDSVGTVKEFLDDSKVANYQEWIEKDFFKYNIDMRWTENKKSSDAGTPERCFRMSMQLRVADVGHLLDTALSIPYKAHNDSWQRFLNIVENNEPKENGGPIRPSYTSKKFVASIVHISELNAFDWVIGNDDRSPNKNNFVVGGCRHKGQCADVVQHDKLLHPGPPTFIHLDQGMSFYGKPKRNGMSRAIRNESAAPSFCVFRAPLVNRLEVLGGYSGKDLASVQADVSAQGSWEKAVEKLRPKTVFHEEMLKRLPKGVRRFVDDHALRKASSRLHEVLRLVRRCLAIDTELRRWVITP